MLFTGTNEKAILVWLNSDLLTFRFAYSNRFYGSCQLVGRLIQQSSNITLDEDSVAVESTEPRRGEPGALQNLAQVFLRRILAPCRSVDEINRGRAI